MAAYLDTSALIPLFFAEPASLAVRTRVRHEARLQISHWALAEFASAAAMKLRSGQTDAATLRTALDKLYALVASGHLPLAPVLETDFERAAQLCLAHASGLRTPDALHAAIASRLRLVLLSCDIGQAQGCRHHGIRFELIQP